MSELNVDGSREINDKVIEKFLANFIIGGKDDCWEWFGSTHDGYGKFTVKNIFYFAHRVSWLYCNNKLKSNLLILHTCDNRLCVNWHHLYAGTNSDNQRDRSLRKPESYGHCVGENNNAHKLTDNKIKDIRLKRILGAKLHQLAKEYKISENYISLICQGKRWSHVKDYI